VDDDMSEKPPTEETPSPRRWTLKRILKEVIEIAVIMLVVVGGMTLYQRADQGGNGGSLPTGSPAPAFSLVEMATGETVNSQDLVGRPTILNFWATWCGPCRSELPDLARLHEQSKGRYRLMTITDEPPGIVKAFLENRRLDLPVLYDPGGRVARGFGVDAIPMTVLLDGQGLVVHDFVGAAYPDILLERMEELISTEDSNL
jgi:thiol-disulfide isomerase/thioredoxin